MGAGVRVLFIILMLLELDRCGELGYSEVNWLTGVSAVIGEIDAPGSSNIPTGSILDEARAEKTPLFLLSLGAVNFHLAAKMRTGEPSIGSSRT